MMVFFALCAQCFSTLATVRRETGSRKWAYFMFAYMTALAYIGAFVVQLLGKALGN
jgi:ferrous iron transport protein B